MSAPMLTATTKIDDPTTEGSSQFTGLLQLDWSRSAKVWQACGDSLTWAIYGVVDGRNCRCRKESGRDCASASVLARAFTCGVRSTAWSKDRGGQSAPTTWKSWLTKMWCGQLTPM